MISTVNGKKIKLKKIAVEKAFIIYADLLGIMLFLPFHFLD